jgi:hypothetical protein
MQRQGARVKTKTPYRVRKIPEHQIHCSLFANQGSNSKSFTSRFAMNRIRSPNYLRFLDPKWYPLESILLPLLELHQPWFSLITHIVRYEAVLISLFI